MQFELIRFRKQILTLFSHRSLDSCRQTLSSSPLGGRNCHTLFTIQLTGALACFCLLSCSPNYAITLCRQTYCQHNDVQPVYRKEQRVQLE